MLPAPARTLNRSGRPTVVCVHGATLDHRAFDSQIPDLRLAGYGVVTWDLPGHGTNQDAVASLSTAADDLLTLIDHLGGGEVIVMGQSFGGLVAQEVARRAPDKVAAMVLIGAPPLSDRPKWHHRVVTRMRPIMLKMWPERHLRRVLPGFLSKHDEVRDYLSVATGLLSKGALITATKAAIEPLLAAGPSLPSPVPVLLVRGEMEVSFVADMIDAWAARDSRVDVVVMPGAGHLANQDEPVAFNTTMLRFLEEHVPSEVLL